MANIYDIAREAGVSRSTVSRVINNQPSVSKDKRERVLAAISKLRYTPSATARALATNKTNAIGVTSRELAHSFFDEFIKSIHYCADDRKYGVLYTMYNAHMHTNIDFASLMHKKVDGYMFVGQGTTTESELKALVHNDMPVVGYEFSYRVNNALFININNKESAYNASRYLYELGHRHIIHLTYLGDLQEMSLREEGYYQAVRELGLGADRVFRMPFDHIDIYEACKKVVDYIRIHKVTAAFCSSNIIATYLIEVLLEKGILVPENFSVIGFDDTPVERPIRLNRQLIPEITSIKQPQKEMGAYGINALITAIEEEKPMKSAQKIFDCQLVERGTTARRIV